MKKIIKTILILLCLFIAIPTLALGYFIVMTGIQDSNVNEFAQETKADYEQGIAGAVYIPSNDYNAWQMYSNFNEDEINRDLGYAQSIGLNAIRVFTSYEYWLDNPTKFFNEFENLIVIANRHGIRVMPVLFEDCGVDNTFENRTANTDETGYCVCSPCREIQKNKDRYSEVDGYIDAFMKKYGNDKRLLAIEIMNEPHLISGNIGFAKYALQKARSYDGCVPLTMGQLTIFHNLLFAGQLDIYQYHDNYPNSTTRLELEMKLGNFLQEVTGKPFWLTEWQRVRSSGGGWGVADIPEEEKTPDLASLATVIKENKVSNFFWSLMVKKAYLPTQRLNGTFNGLFYEDGSVYSPEDKKAVTVK